MRQHFNAPSRGSSSALEFLQAAYAAMPRTLGDRDCSASMNSLMRIAIESRMKFSRSDVSELKELSLVSCVGVFRPVDEWFYNLACQHGGTYAAMYEHHTGLKPWIAPVTYTSELRTGNYRVAPGIAVLIAQQESPQDRDLNLPRYLDMQVWWCTSVANDAIMLCRYGKRHQAQDRHHSVWDHDGPPVRRQKLSREEWQALFPEPEEQADAPAAAVARERG